MKVATSHYSCLYYRFSSSQGINLV
jgi:hypothetical protein